jgi:ATP-dependent Clp protease ATP-binding subunit ClpB
VLFDEIEKAHPDVFNTLLQVLDDGRLTDNKGRVVNFKNTIIIMTSNLGSDIIREKFEGLNDQNREEVTEDAKEAVLELLKKTVRPEFLNRIDEIVMFSPLDEAEILSIVKIQVDSILRMIKGNGVTLNISDEALKFIAEEGYDPQFGARPVKRVIQRRLLNELSKKLISQTVQRDKPIVIDVKDGELVLEN